MHSRNIHKGKYDLELLTKSNPELGPYVKKNKYGNESIDFFNPKAVKSLNKALLLHYYDIEYWDIPSGNLCPPVPGRADYIYHMADLLSSRKINVHSSEIRILDIGVGASCIYPIIGTSTYGWEFVGSETNKASIEAAQNIIDKNTLLQNKLSVRIQKDKQHILNGIVGENETFTACMCNPPFHASSKEDSESSLRKLRNLKKKRNVTAVQNFGGNADELWCEGGERQFVLQLIQESVGFAPNFTWFTCLVSKESNIPIFIRVLKDIKARNVHTIDMGIGNKKSRILAWRFASLKSKR